MRLFIVHHTHWDREWFLPANFTSEWLIPLCERLISLCEENPSFKFVLDGQTLILEDLKQVSPSTFGKIKRFISSGNLLTGPYYCQVDWRIADGESLFRNLMLGLLDAGSIGEPMMVGWLLDNFGHPSQSPQIHSIFGIRGIFLWRGPYKLSSEFEWSAPDGSRALVVFLYGGYRSLYGLGRIPELIERRIKSEVGKMRYQLTDNLVLLDGYDLDLEPEDSSRFLPDKINSILLSFGGPSDYLSAVRKELKGCPVCFGELISGKYACTFPGTLSTRTYLKIESADLEDFLYRVIEPLLALNGKEALTSFWREVLKELVHDNICGVGIDQIHEGSERKSFLLFKKLRKILKRELSALLRSADEGYYAVNLIPQDYDLWYPLPSGEYRLSLDGVGFFRVDEISRVRRLEESAVGFKWKNSYYEAEIMEDGSVKVRGGVLGFFTLEEEHGDTYSHVKGELLATTRGMKLKPVLIRQGKHHAEVRYEARVKGKNKEALLSVRILLDETPLIRWKINLDSDGTDLRVRMGFEFPRPGELFAGSQYDFIKRGPFDEDLLPEKLPPELSSLLIAARETGRVENFPFQDIIVFYDGALTHAVLAKGLREYEWDGGRSLYLTLRRAVEWIARKRIPGRVGDAGPEMYVPGARCERKVRHLVGYMALTREPWNREFYKWMALFKTPPLIVYKKGRGTLTGRIFFSSFPLPITAFYRFRGKTLLRSFNPYYKWCELESSVHLTDPFGAPLEETREIPPKKIFTFKLDLPLGSPSHEGTYVRVLNPPSWRVGKSRSSPSDMILENMEKEAKRLRKELEGRDITELSHEAKAEYYTLKRRLLELELSIALNRRKPGKVLKDIGLRLNEARAWKRIYDYILALHKHNKR